VLCRLTEHVIKIYMLISINKRISWLHADGIESKPRESQLIFKQILAKSAFIQSYVLPVRVVYETWLTFIN